MYLVEIDEETGLIKEDPTNDSWKGIKDFRAVVKKFGMEGLTVVAFSCDYLTPYKHYNNEDRPMRAMDEIYGNRNELDLKNKILVAAFEKYKELQFNPDLEQERINGEIKIRLLGKISKANAEDNDVDIEKYNKALQRHEASIANFNKRFDKKKAIESAVTSSGYQLSRIENDILSRKNSKFVNHGEDVKNPNKLKLED